MTSCLIIGCGYVGTRLASHWASTDYAVTVSTTSPHRLPELKQIADHAVVLRGSDLKLLTKQLTDKSIVVVSVAPNGRNGDYRETYLKTAHSLLGAVRSGAQIHQVIYTGSASVYGDADGGWVDEEMKLEPSVERQAILLETEETLLSLEELGVKVCILRLGQIYGPGRSIQERLRKLQSQTLPGDPQSITNLSHVDDIVGAVDFATKTRLSGIFNICGNTHLGRAEFYTRISTALKLEPVYWKGDPAPVHGGRRKLSTKKIQKTGFVFLHPSYQFPL